VLPSYPGSWRRRLDGMRLLSRGECRSWVMCSHGAGTGVVVVGPRPRACIPITVTLRVFTRPSYSDFIPPPTVWYIFLWLGALAVMLYTSRTQVVFPKFCYSEISNRQVVFATTERELHTTPI
jgi:hypothetical protein